MRPIEIWRSEDAKEIKDIIQDMEKRKNTREGAIAIITNSHVCPFRYNRFFMCLYCKHSCLTMTELMEHNTNDHNTIDESVVRRALVRIGRIQPIKINFVNYRCKLCDVERDEMLNFNDLKHHLIGEHNIAIDLTNDGVVPFRITDDEYVCARCEKKYDNYRLLSKHINDHYSYFICDQCGSGFPSEGRLKSHSTTHEAGSHPCDVCGKVYRSAMAKQDHYKTVHLNVKKNKCTHCDETFRDYYQKQKHLAVVHGLTRNNYICGFCPKTFFTSSNLRSHERLTHVKVHKFNCDHCSYHTYDKYALTLHMACHSDEKNFMCQVCKKTYARKKTLTEHMRIHNNDRRHACQYCDRAFVQKCSLKGHMRTHHRDVLNLVS